MSTPWHRNCNIFAQHPGANLYNKADMTTMAQFDETMNNAKRALGLCQ
jgi:hypothetical protein